MRDEVLLPFGAGFFRMEIARLVRLATLYGHDFTLCQKIRPAVPSASYNFSRVLPNQHDFDRLNNYQLFKKRKHYFSKGSYKTAISIIK